MKNVKSQYSQIFDFKCKEWSENREFNLMYLKTQERYFNDVLRDRGYVFLRDIHECLGIPVTKTSLFVGWFHDLSNPFIDNYIDFGIEEDGCESNVKLDFNVDGDITNYFKE